MHVVEVMVLEDAMPSSVAVTFDMLTTANRLRLRGERPAPFSVCVTGSGAQWALSFVRNASLTLVNAVCDVMIVPGLGVTTEQEIIDRMARADAKWACSNLSEAAARGADIATSCSGSFLVAATGLLNDRRATTSWWLAPSFHRMHPTVVLDTDALVVRDGPITTAGAALAQMDLMLSVIARHADTDLASECASYLLLDQRRSQSRYMALGFLTSADQCLARAEAWARRRLSDGFTINDLAAAAGLAPRTFARRVVQVTGLSPIRFVQRLRIERAVELLETTLLPFEEIARRVGYAEPSTLRRIIQRDGQRGPRR